MEATSILYFLLGCSMTSVLWFVLQLFNQEIKPKKNLGTYILKKIYLHGELYNIEILNYNNINYVCIVDSKNTVYMRFFNPDKKFTLPLFKNTSKYNVNMDDSIKTYYMDIKIGTDFTCYTNCKCAKLISSTRLDNLILPSDIMSNLVDMPECDANYVCCGKITPILDFTVNTVVTNNATPLKYLIDNYGLYKIPKKQNALKKAISLHIIKKELYKNEPPRNVRVEEKSDKKLIQETEDVLGKLIASRQTESKNNLGEYQKFMLEDIKLPPTPVYNLPIPDEPLNNQFDDDFQKIDENPM
jgi:hypothetical protein